jgi:hypothetical protein
VTSLLQQLAHVCEYGEGDAAESAGLAVEYRRELFGALRAAGRDDATCAICLEAVSPEESGLAILPKCLHCFHKVCLDPWTATGSGCPSCRRKAPVEAAAFARDTTFHLRMGDGGGCYSVGGFFPSCGFVNLTNRVAQGVRNGLVLNRDHPLMDQLRHDLGPGRCILGSPAQARLFFTCDP